MDIPQGLVRGDPGSRISERYLMANPNIPGFQKNNDGPANVRTSRRLLWEPDEKKEVMEE